MSNEKVVKELDKIKLKKLHAFTSNISTSDSNQDILYQANQIVFQDSSINHKKRLLLLKKVNSISLNFNLPFCIAHNLTLSIKVAKEIGLQDNLIKDSHRAIELWKSILDQPLAINGLIFSYIDLGLIFSSYNLKSLALKYLDKAESLLSECSDQYYPFIKLYVAYAIILEDSKKIDACNKKVNDIAKSKKDFMTLIPVLVNIASRLIVSKKYNDAKNKCLQALKISDENKENIYKPHIYNALGEIFLKKKKYSESEIYFEKALSGFESMNIDKMIPEAIYNLGLIKFYKKKYKSSCDLFNKSLQISNKMQAYELSIKNLKKISLIYKQSKDGPKYIKIIQELNEVFEKQIKNREKLFSDTNANALKHLSKEFDLSLRKHKDLQLRLDIESKKRELTTEALMSVSEREFLNKIIQGLSSQKLDNKRIMRLCRQRINYMKDWNIFMKLFNDIHPEFNRYIISKCSSITESELRICNLIKMSFSTSEIADILSITRRGVEQHRYRIKKKLCITSDLSIFLQSL